MMEDIKKFIIFLSIFGCLFFYFYYNEGNKDKQLQTQERLITLMENSVKRENIVSNDKKVEELKQQFKNEKSEILKAFEEQKKKTKETIDELGQLKAKLDASRELRVTSDKIYKKDTQDKNHWYFFKKINIKNKDGEEIPVAWAMFYPYRSPDKQWKVGTYDLKVDTKIIESQNKDGSFNRYGEVNLLNKNGYKLPVKIEKFKWAKVFKKDKHFFFWNPRIALGSIFTIDGGAGFDLNMSFMSYGKTNRDMDWRFLTIGAGMINNDFSVSFEPFGWNVGNVLPIVQNFFVGPYVGYDFNNFDNFNINNYTDLNYGFQMSVPF